MSTPSRRIYDLSYPLEASTPVSGKVAPFRMALNTRHGDRVFADGASGSNELFTMSGHTGTHIDALCHIGHRGKLYGGIDAAGASRGGRYSSLGMETLPPVYARGVLLDVAAALGVDTLDAAFAVTPEHLELAERHAGVQVQAGDAVLIHTGWARAHYDDPVTYGGETTGVPGPNAAAAGWLAERGISITGTDTMAYEMLPPEGPMAGLPAHVVLLVENGIPILETMDLRPLVDGQVATFDLIVAPLKIVGATGSPVRPLAVVGEAA